MFRRLGYLTTKSEEIATLIKRNRILAFSWSALTHISTKGTENGIFWSAHRKLGVCSGPTVQRGLQIPQVATGRSGDSSRLRRVVLSCTEVLAGGSFIHLRFGRRFYSVVGNYQFSFYAISGFLNFFQDSPPLKHSVLSP